MNKNIQPLGTKREKKDDLSTVNQIGIDDTSTKEGHNFVTLNLALEKPIFLPTP